MANIQGTNVAAPVVPFTTEDIYATHDAKYGKGGYRSVNTYADLDTITENRLEIGMAVYVIANNQMYVYDGLDQSGVRKWSTPIATQAGVDLEIIATKEFAKNKANDAEAAAKADTASKIEALDMQTVGETGSFIETVSETDGVVTATKKQFAQSVTADGTIAPTAKAIYDHVAQAVAPLAGATHFRGIVQELPDPANYQDGDIVMLGTKEYILYNGTWTEFGDEGAWDLRGAAAQALQDAQTYTNNKVNNLDLQEVGQVGKFIQKVSQADGQVAAIAVEFASDLATGGNTAPTSTAAKIYIDNKIDALDLAQQGGTGKYIEQVSQTDGQVAAVERSLIATIDNSNVAPTSGAVKTYVDNAVGAITGDIVTVSFYKDSIDPLNLICKKKVFKGSSVEWPSIDYDTYSDNGAWSVSEENLMNVQQDMDVVFEVLTPSVARYYQHGNYGDDYENYVYRSDREVSKVEIDGTTYYVAVKETEDPNYGILINNLMPDASPESEYVPYATFYENPESLMYENSVVEKHWIYKVEFSKEE